MHKKTKEVYWEQVYRKLKEISQTRIFDQGHVCYIANIGGMAKSNYIDFQENKDLEVVIFERFKSKSILQNAFSFIFQSYWGVVKVKRPTSINKVFDKLTEQCMAELYIFKELYEKDFLVKVKASESPLSISNIVEVIPGSFLYLVDTDNIESSTGTLEVIIYSDDSPTELKDIVELASFR